LSRGTTLPPEKSFRRLVENHCPICVAAAACTNLCAGELHVFQAVLGEDVAVERTDHILAGARRCAYRISKRTRRIRSER
jgi:predicted ArsR family transcriptional regulator